MISTDELADLSAAIAAIGSQFNPERAMQTRALYAPFVRALPWSQSEMVRDIPYGVDPRHRLDVAPAAQPGSPVLLFLHGGGFVAGEKDSDGLFYSNIPRYFASHGYCAVSANYRLAQTDKWPAGAEDCAAIIDWIRDNAGDHGGDAGRIVILGQSAGASHVATWLFDPRFEGSRSATVRGAALLSGFYRPSPAMLGGPKLYYGDDESRYEGQAVTSHVASGHIPLLLTIAEYDPAIIAEQTLLLAGALNQADGSPPRLLWAEGHNHVSGIHGLGVGDDLFGAALRRFFASTLASEAQAR